MQMYPSYTSIYHAIQSYDGICEYMSGYQGVRIPDSDAGRRRLGRPTRIRPSARGGQAGGHTPAPDTAHSCPYRRCLMIPKFNLNVCCRPGADGLLGGQGPGTRTASWTGS
jgi:hypothetical protein